MLEDEVVDDLKIGCEICAVTTTGSSFQSEF